jgi:hypothetical protein
MQLNAIFPSHFRPSKMKTSHSFPHKIPAYFASCMSHMPIVPQPSQRYVKNTYHGIPNPVMPWIHFKLISLILIYLETDDWLVRTEKWLATDWATPIPFPAEALLFLTTTRPALDLPNFITGTKRPKHEADHSPQSIGGVIHVWSYTSIPTRDCGVMLHYAYGKTYFTYRDEKSEKRC